jgi:DNA-binding transcriptional LysR family regulator
MLFMDTAYLNTFLLVADAGSMSEAARRLDLTPAAIAQQMRVLERELGTALIMRSGRTVAPTEAGHRLVERARGLLREFGTLKALVNDEAAGSELRIGAINTALHSLLPEVLAGFVKRFPQVRVHIRSAMTAELYEAMQRSELDAAVCLHPSFSLPKTLNWELLREEPLTVLAPQRWAKRDPHQLLAREPFIRYARELGGGKQVDRYLRKAGITPHERFELSSLAAIAMLVDRGLGVALVPDAATPWWPGLRLARLPLPGAQESRRFGIVWERASVRGRLIQGLVDEARRVVAAP